MYIIMVSYGNLIFAEDISEALILASILSHALSLTSGPLVQQIRSPGDCQPQQGFWKTQHSS